MWNLTDPESPSRGVALPLPGRRKKWVTNALDVTITPAGRLLAISQGIDSGKIGVWDLDRMELIGKPLPGHGKYAQVGGISIVTTPAGRTLAISADSRGVILVWNLDDLDQIRQACRPTKGQGSEIRSVIATVTPDGRTLAFTGSLDTLHVWDLDALSEDRPLKAAGPSVSLPNAIFSLAALATDRDTLLLMGGYSGYALSEFRPRARMTGG